MAEFPSMPVFTDALVADCHHLTDEEFGRYMRLLIIMWRTPGCKIPDDHIWISKRINCDALAYAKLVQPLLQEFCKKVDGFWTQKRLQKEYKYLQELREKRRKAAAKRWGNENGIDNKGKNHKQVDMPCISKADAPTPTPHLIKPPTPLKGGRSFSDEKNGGGAYTDNSKYNVEVFLSDKAIDQAKKQAPGWDLYGLIEIYNEGIRSGKRERPDNPKKAFPAWCGRYTKGKPP